MFLAGSPTQSGQHTDLARQLRTGRSHRRPTFRVSDEADFTTEEMYLQDLTNATEVALSVLFYFYPRVPAYSLVVVFSWLALALLYRGYRLYRTGKPDR
jgi:hypothetical protein